MKPYPLLFVMLLLMQPFSALASCELARQKAMEGAERMEGLELRGLRLFREAAALCPEDPAFHAHLAKAFWHYGYGDRAVEAMEKALAIQNRADWQANLGLMYMQRGEKPERAKALTAAAHQQFPDHEGFREADRLVGGMLAALASQHMQGFSELVMTILRGEGRPSGTMGLDPAVFFSMFQNAGKAAPGQPVTASPPADAEEQFEELGFTLPRGKAGREIIAVVIGNRRYETHQKGVLDVNYAERDAALIRRFLMESLGVPERNILFETNVGSAGFQEIFGTRDRPEGRLHGLAKRMEGRAEIFVYYSGHGAPGQDGKSAFLIPVDTGVDYVDISGYPLDLFYKNLASLPAASITVALDACFSGNSGAGPLYRNISSAMLRNMQPLPEPQAQGKPVPQPKSPAQTQVKTGKTTRPAPAKTSPLLVFAAADKDQVAVWHRKKGHGLFTYHFVRGLSGEADKNRDKKVTAGELHRYVREKVAGDADYFAHGRKQEPVKRGNANHLVLVME